MRAPKLLAGILITLAATAVVLVRVALISSPEQVALYFLDVGQGDSQLVELPGGIHVLIDGGPSGSALLRNLAAVLPQQKKYIDVVVMTHPELDHFAGFIDMLKNYEVGAFISTGRTRDNAAYSELVDQLELHRVKHVQLREGGSITYGAATFSALGPSPQDAVSKELNDSSLVLLLRTPDFSALYTGDIGEDVESELTQKYNIDVDLLKVAHHGSKFSSSAGFLKEASPQISVIGVGKNSYGHPTAQAMSRLERFSEQIFRTDQDGIIKIVFENGALVRK